MTGPKTPPLGGDFPTATRDEWRKLVDAVLKGAPFERLTSRTRDGLTIEPLYLRARDAHTIAARPGGTAWSVMQRVDHPDPAAANAQALEDLNNGATGLVLVYSLNTWLPELMLRAGFNAKGSLSFLLVLNGGAILGAVALRLPPIIEHLAGAVGAPSARQVFNMVRGAAPDLSGHLAGSGARVAIRLGLSHMAAGHPSPKGLLGRRSPCRPAPDLRHRIRHHGSDRRSFFTPSASPVK